MPIFTIDGMEFDVDVTELKRKFAVTDTDNSGRTMNGNMHRDIIGTYYNYTLSIEPKKTEKSRKDYDTLYELLSAPVESRILVVPYAQSTLKFKAYITNGEDNLKIRKSLNLWDGLSVNFIATEPQRRP